MRKKMFIRKDEEGVSPVIATILMVAITVVLAGVLYIMVSGIPPPGDVTPTGVWGPETVKSSTSVDVDFGAISPHPEPVDLEIVLVRNGTYEGRYSFTSNDDGVLTLAGGEDVGTLTYFDRADNERVNRGDLIRIANLFPGSEYTLIMIWDPNGDMIDTTTFSTPGY